MVRKYLLTPGRRLANLAVRLAIAAGVAPRHYYMLGVKGRRSGRMIFTPVWCVESGARYLVSPYGDVNWVKNVRLANEVTLRRAGRSETVRVAEVGPQESAPVLKTYLTRIPITQPFFDIRPDAPLEAFAAEAPRHPVFRIAASGAKPFPA